MLEFNDESLNAAISSGKPVVVDFWATWCGPCKMLAPIVEALAHEYDGRVVIGKYDVEDAGEAAAEYGIRGVPTLLYFKDGKLADRSVGALPQAAIKAKIEALL